MKQYSVYIMTNASRTLYVGVTNDLARRVYEHNQKLVPGFTEKYNITQLVWYEHFSGPYDAISREKQLKRWRREKKVALIRSENPEWKDLSQDEEPERPLDSARGDRGSRSLDCARDERGEDALPRSPDSSVIPGESDESRNPSSSRSCRAKSRHLSEETARFAPITRGDESACSLHDARGDKGKG